MQEDGTQGDVHPIAQLALKLLKKQGHALTLGAQGKERLAAALRKYARLQDKKVALKELVCLSWFFENKKKSPHASRELLSVIEAESSELVAAGESLFVDGEQLQEAAKRFHRHMGESTAKSAPKVGEDEPSGEGIVKAGMLGKTRRI
jgi:hypothetical protein